MSRYVKEIENKEFIEIVKELDSKDHFFSKVSYCFEITGIQCLLPGEAEVRMIEGIKYVWGVDPTNKYEASHVMNIICNQHTALFYKVLSNSFTKKLDTLELYRLQHVAEAELEEISEKIKNGNNLFQLGYRSEKKSDEEIYFENIEPTNENC